MTRRRSTRSSSSKPLGELNQTSNVLQSHKYSANNNNNNNNTTSKPKTTSVDQFADESRIEGIDGLKSILDDDSVTEPQPGTSTCTSAQTTTVENFTSNTAALYDELDSFRQRWKRELEVTKCTDHQDENEPNSSANKTKNDKSFLEQNDDKKHESSIDQSNATLKESFAVTSGSDLQNDPKQIYALAKKLFLIGVDLEQDEMHHESIRYYKQAVHLCPDIEKQIFREQCEASARASNKQASEQTKLDDMNGGKKLGLHDKESVEEMTPLLERVRQSYCDDLKNNHCYCRPSYKHKTSGTSIHISQLPHEIILQIFRHVVGQELDLASLESLGMVCRGFFLLSRDQSLWRSVCMSTWGNEIKSLMGSRSMNETVKDTTSTNSHIGDQIDWRLVYLDNPRVNYDGVYISRTRYIRQGDVGFQDITYRPFHVIRYYRYLRFFSDRRVLILTTNEEPERIVPIFRHALRAKQFSSELSILEGTYEFSSPNQVTIVADKDCRNICAASSQVQTNQSNRRQAQLMWSRQTPLAQKFNLKFELKTVENRPYRNNVLKWLNYTILTRLETGEEITSFDLNPDTFPNLVFSRVRRFNLRSLEPLASH